ncbi:hypothetical protein CF54_04170 [Streptomyces sp. Tu 6176]|uniref:hypothetical protein n=1 Tax=Streptomyces sp. Tu 6176 TaxID=1470557 RepID=UPI00044FAB66|nr:hypothetical protein [Streptomyces sp. Tu 6176]EYT83975.1 hypothetical protein CF54_04170 [Streptomyces sp. Tu 6176]
MTRRTDTIAAVLRRPVLKRPVVGHELRERLVQGLGPGSTDAAWTATVPQLAEAIDTALTTQERREQKGTRSRGRRLAGGSTARAQILAALVDAGHSPAAAADLLARAYREPRPDGTAPSGPDSTG